MTDATLTAADRAALAALGFTLTGVSVWSIGACTVEAVPHGAWHYKLTVTLPSGARIEGFVARSKIIPTH